MSEKIVPLQIARLELHPGDILVMKVPAGMRIKHVNLLRDELQRYVGPSVKVMILDAGSELTVVRRQDIAIAATEKAR